MSLVFVVWYMVVIGDVELNKSNYNVSGCVQIYLFMYLPVFLERSVGHISNETSGMRTIHFLVTCLYIENDSVVNLECVIFRQSGSDTQIGVLRSPEVMSA